MKLSVLIPIYNEANTVIPLLKQVEAVAVDKEVIVVDDCSSDGTRELLQGTFGEGHARFKIFFHEKNRGKGASVMTALRHATGEFCIIQDGDMEYNPCDYQVLVQAAEDANVSAVYGSRFLGSCQKNLFIHYWGNRMLTLATNLLFFSRLTDMETCYKLIKTDVFKSLAITSERFDVEAEITARLLQNGHTIKEIPITYKGRSYHEGKKITWKDGVATLATLVRCRVR